MAEPAAAAARGGRAHARRAPRLLSRTNTLLVQHAFTISSAGAFSATTSAGSLVVLPAVVLGTRLVPACRLMRANTAFVLLGAVLLVMAEHAGGPRAAW